jgi:hypothetical protein
MQYFFYTHPLSPPLKQENDLTPFVPLSCQERGKKMKEELRPS